MGNILFLHILLYVKRLPMHFIVYNLMHILLTVLSHNLDPHSILILFAFFPSFTEVKLTNNIVRYSSLPCDDLIQVYGVKGQSLFSNVIVFMPVISRELVWGCVAVKGGRDKRKCQEADWA